MLAYVALLALALVFGGWLASRDFAYPVWYRFRARQHGCAPPRVVWYWPLGIPFARQMIRNAREERFLTAVKDQHFALPRGTLTFMRQGLFMWVFATRDPENVKALLATDFASFSLGNRNPQLEPVFGSGIFTQDGAAWKHSRAMLRPQFSREQVSRLDSIGRHIDTLVSQIGGRPVEMQRLLHLLTMDTATEFLFGESVGSLHFSDSGSRGSRVVDRASGDEIWSADFVESYTYLNELAFKRLLLNGLSWTTRFTEPDAAFHLRRAHIFIDHFVQEALQAEAEAATETDDRSETARAEKAAQAQDAQAKGAQAKDAATKEAQAAPAAPTKYVFSRELARGDRNPVVLRNQLFNILIAGRDTTASTLSFSVYYLALYPAAWTKLHAEVAEMMPAGTDVTYEKLRRLTYTQSFIKEVLRVAPVVPLNVRTAIRDTVLPRGGGPDGSKPVFVPKGSEVNYSAYVLHRDPAIYGADADEFRPERWTEERKSSAMSAWGYIPFNGGPRICLGQQFALTEIALTLVKLAQAFSRLERAPGFPSQRIDRTFLTLQVGGPGVPVVFKP